VRRYIVAAAIAAVFVVPVNGLALTVTQASLSNGRLHVTGAGAQPNVFVIAASFGNSAGIRSDLQGGFTIDKSGFVAEDCKVVVGDTTTPIAVPTLSGCTPIAPKPVSSSPPAPTGSCVITPATSTPSLHVGDNGAAFFATTGCAGPVTWSLVAGRAPLGLHLGLQGQTGGGLTGRPVTEGTSTFTLKVTDQGGETDYENFSVTITAPRPITITPATLPGARVGSSYQVNLRGDGGLPGYLWSVAGPLPPGFALSRNMLFSTNATTAGTYTFTIRATDSRGTIGSHTYTLTVS
jgi:hypothetical protein